MKKKKSELRFLKGERTITVIFSIETICSVIYALRVTKACHGELLMEDSKTMFKIIKAMALGKKTVNV